MPTYNKDVKAFTKWLPVKAWFSNNPVAVSVAAGSIVAACDKINRKVNKSFVYQRDGISDMWRTPPQFVSNHGGDCEDFSIYKMSQLAAAGVALAKMELVICFDKFSREYHNVLRVFDGASEYVLDNQTVPLLGKDAFKTRYSAIYAINLSGWRVLGN
jgi:predicted transglutaminase-like cysteine proteinase